MMPILARVYHIAPSEQARLTLSDFAALCRDYERLETEEG